MRKVNDISISGSVQEKKGRLYAVLNYKDENGKRKTKWKPLGLPVGSGVRLVKEMLSEAEKEFEKEYAEYLEKQGRADSDTPLFSYLTSWLAMVKATIQPTTYRSYSNMINGKIKKWFDKPNITLGSVTGRQINQFYQSFFDDGLKANTAIHYHSVLHKAFKHAVKNDMILVNPCEKADRPKKNKFRGKYYSQEELQTLLALSTA